MEEQVVDVLDMRVRASSPEEACLIVATMLQAAVELGYVKPEFVIGVRRDQPADDQAQTEPASSDTAAVLFDRIMGDGPHANEQN